MEKQQHEAQPEPRGWDGVPRDGPWVFVVDKAAWDRGEVIGTWLDPWTPPELVAKQLGELLGRSPQLDELAVVEQVGLGEEMVDEDWFR